MVQYITEMLQKYNTCNENGPRTFVLHYIERNIDYAFVLLIFFYLLKIKSVQPPEKENHGTTALIFCNAFQGSQNR